MMIDINKKYRTRDGHPVELVTTSGRGKWPVWGYIGDDTNIMRWTIDGSDGHTTGTTRSSVKNDLVEVKPKRVLWLNVYSDGDSVSHESREDADIRSLDGRIACLKIEFEEGEGL